MEESQRRTLQVAEFVRHTGLSEVPASAIVGAKLVILDTLGVGLAAVEQPVVDGLERYLRTIGGEPVATVIGSGGYRSSAPSAAMANGFLFNILDFDTHTATFILAAVLALGEMLDSSGVEVLEAFIVGWEAATRIDEVIDYERDRLAGPSYRGWYHVGLSAAIGSALASGKLLGLEVDGLLGAMGTASVVSGGVRKNMGSRSKGMFPGTGASFGVTAALLAREGVTGNGDILEGSGGVVAASCLPGEYAWEPLDELGRSYALSHPKQFKTYPAVSPLQRAIKAIIELRRDAPWEIEDITEIEADIAFQPATGMTDTVAGVFRYPEDELGTNFSWPYTIAATLCHGAFSPDQVTEEALRDPRTVALASRVSCRLAKSKYSPGAIRIHLSSGEVLSADTPLPRHGTSEADYLEKFNECAARHLQRREVALLAEQVQKLEGLERVAELMATLGTGKS